MQLDSIYMICQGHLKKRGFHAGIFSNSYLTGYTPNIYLGGTMKYYIQTPAQLGVALRSHRKQKRLSQKEAAKNVGLLPKTISNLENYTVSARIGSMFKLLFSLGLEIIITPKTENSFIQNKTEW